MDETPKSRPTPTPNEKVCCLILTRACNLNCVYCYEKHKTGAQMSFEVAQAVILEELARVVASDEFDALRVEFFGGEPFLEFELLRRVVDWVRSEERPVPFRFFATTNGTVLTPDAKRWLREQKDWLTVGLSFDGTPEMQNVNRSGSFGDVDLSFFRENYPRQTIKMTISSKTVKIFAEGVVYLLEQGFRVDPSCACGDDWDESLCEEYRRQLFALARYYLARPDVEPIDLFKLSFAASTQPLSRRAQCGAGRSFVAYDVDGTAYPCHLFAPVTLGKPSEISIDDFQTRTDFLDPRCQHCALANLCPSCYGYNYARSGRIERRDERFCALFRAQCQAVAWFKKRRFEEKKRRRETFAPGEIADMKGVVYYCKNLEKIGVLDPAPIGSPQPVAVAALNGEKKK